MGSLGSRSGRILFCLLLWCAVRAHAQTPASFEVDWHSDAACDSPQNLAAEIARLTRPDLTHTEGWRFDVHVTRVSELLLLDFSARGSAGAGRRQLSLGSCREVQEAAILLIAMTLDPEAQGQIAPTADQPPVPQAKSPPAPVKVSAARAAPRLRGSLGATLVFDPLALGKPSLGPSLVAALDARSIRVSLRATYLVARALDGLPEGATGQVDLLSAAVGLGARFERRNLSFGPLAELELGAVRGRVSGLPDARGSASLWASVLGGAWLELPARGRVAAQLSVQGGVPLRRPRFGLHGGPANYTTPAALVRLHLGVVIRFGATTD